MSEIETEVTVEAPEETEEETEETTTDAEETPEAKPKETPEAKRARLQRQLKRLNKELGEVDDEPVTKVTKKSGEFDYGEKAFLKASGITGAEELAFAKSWIDRTGDDLDTVVDDEIFQAKLEKLRSNKKSKVAIPPTGKRGTQASSSSVEYWLAKPFAEVPADMKRQVLNARISKEGNHKL